MPTLLYHPDVLYKWMKGEYFSPLYVEISPTSLCNQKCFFCYTSQVMKENPVSIPGDLLIKIFKDLARAGVKSCEVQGTGEPLLNKALPDAIVAGKKGGMDICLCTNGTLLNEGILEKITPCLSFFRFSSLECSPELYAKTHGSSEEDFHKVIKAMKTAIKIKERDGLDTVIVASFVAFDYNTPFIVETAQMLKEIGVNIFTIKTPIEMSKNIGHKFKQGLHINYKSLFDKAKALSNDNFKFNIRTDFFDYCQDPKSRHIERDFTYCYGAEFEIMIGSDAKIYPCMCLWGLTEYCLGDLTKMDFEKVWKSDERKKAMKHFLTSFVNPTCDTKCKQFAINPILNKLRNPPLHVNVI